MNYRYVLAARPPPVTPRIGAPTSLPNHISATVLPKNPANHASRLYWLVPVFPPILDPGIAAHRPVPVATVPLRNSVMTMYRSDTLDGDMAIQS